MTLPVATLQTNARAQKCHSKRRIHSKGNLSNRQTMMNWPKYEAIRAKVTNSWTTINHPGSSFSRINRYSSPYKAWHPWNKWSYNEKRSPFSLASKYICSIRDKRIFFYLQIGSLDGGICKNKIPKGPCWQTDFVYLSMMLTNMDLQSSSITEHQQ